MNRLYSVLLTILVLGSGTELLEAQEPQNPQARGVQLVPDAPAADIYVDDVEPATFQNIGYLSASRLLTIAPGEHNLKVAPAGTSKNDAIIEETVTFSADSGYVLLATGRIATLDLEPVLLGRSLTLEPAPGQTLVRVFHGSPGVSDLRVSIVDLASGSTEYGSRSFREVTPFRSIPGGAVRVYVRNDAGDTLYGATGSIATGGVITLITSGDPTGEDFRINVLAERNESAVSPMPTLSKIVDTETGRIRVVHMLDGPGTSLDVTLGGGNTTFPSMSYASASDVLTLPAGEIPVSITPVGGGEPLYEGTLNVIGGLYRAAYIVGGGDVTEEDVIVLTADASARPSAGRASARFLNAMYSVQFLEVDITYAGGTNRNISPSSFGTFTPYDKVSPGPVLATAVIADTTPTRYDGLSADSVYTIVLGPDTTFYVVSDDRVEAVASLPEFQPELSVGAPNGIKQVRLTAWPVPTTGQVSMSVDRENAASRIDRINVIDTRGRIVRSFDARSVEVGIGTFRLDLSELSSGAYQLVPFGNGPGSGGSVSVLVVE